MAPFHNSRWLWYILLYVCFRKRSAMQDWRRLNIKKGYIAYRDTITCI